MIELMVQELDVPDAVVVVIGRYRANRHTHSESDDAVTHDDVLAALRILAILVHRLDGDGIVMVRDVESFDQDVLASGVDTIGVEWVRRQGHPVETLMFASSGQEFSKLKLPLHLSHDLEVVNVEAIDVGDVDEVVRRVEPPDSADFDIGAMVHPEELGSAIGVPLDVLSDPPHVALSVDLAIATHVHVMNLRECNEVSDLSMISTTRRFPLMVSLGGCDVSLDRDCHIGEVTRPNGQHVEVVAGWDKHLALTTICSIVRSNDSIHECLCVDLLSSVRIIVRKSTEVSNVMDNRQDRLQQEQQRQCRSFDHNG